MSELIKEAVPVAEVASIAPSVAPYKLLDMWRGVASLWVVIYHASQVFVTRYPPLNANPIYVFGQYGHLGVRIFFVISGYCIAHAACANLRRNQGVRAFLRARFRRIYPPLWCAQALYAVLSLLAALMVARGILKSSVMMENGVLHRSPLYFVGNGLLLALPLRQVLLIGPTWTLCYEVTFYVMVAAAVALASLRRKAAERVMLSTLHVLTVAGLAIIICAPQSALCTYPMDLWPQFGLGVIAYDILHHPRCRAAQMAFLVVVLLTITVIARPEVMLTMLSSSRLTYLMCLAFTLLITALYRYDSALGRLPLVRVGSALGLFSYSLYLTHTILLGMETQILTKLKLSIQWHFVLFVLLLALSVAFARVFFQFCEMPFLNSRSAKGNRAA